MKKFFCILSAHLLSINAWGWECLEGYDRYNDPIEKHIEKASHIVFGTLVSGNYYPKIKYENNLKFTLSILATYKGDLFKEVEFETHQDAYFGELVLGNNYLIFLYGKREIDFCGITVNLGTYYNRVERLNQIWDGDLANIKSLFSGLNK